MSSALAFLFFVGCPFEEINGGAGEKGIRHDKQKVSL